MAEKEMKDFAARAAAFLGDETIADEVVAAQNATKTARSLARERAKQGLSQKEVALRMGVSQSKVCRMEDALDADLSYGDIESYAHALGLDVSLFYDAVDASKAARVANFANASGLMKEGDNLYSATLNSGEFDGIGEDVTAGGGSFSTGVLEMSNVDLAAEFTEMITTQRGYQANSRIITTSDSMLEELVNLKR